MEGKSQIWPLIGSECFIRFMALTISLLTVQTSSSSTVPILATSYYYCFQQHKISLRYIGFSCQICCLLFSLGSSTAICCEFNCNWMDHQLTSVWSFWANLGQCIVISVHSLVSSLTENAYVSSGSFGEQITDGIDITTWVASSNGDSVSFSVWDFAGQTVYYNTHQVSY
jgi:hypothetical protein